MKLSALASIIKACGRCSQITAANGHRFISTGHAVYNMDGYPKAQNKNELAAMLSIPSKKAEDIYFEEERAENNIYYGASLADDPDNEEPVDKLNTRIVVNGEEYIALRHPQRDHRLYPHSAARAGRKRADQRICRYLREMGKLAKRYAGLRGKGWNVPSRSHPSRKAGRCDYG